jgi:hypothetical protein
MQKTKNPIILREDDYQLLNSYLKGNGHVKLHDAKNARELEEELKKATLVSKDNFPC